MRDEPASSFPVCCVFTSCVLSSNLPWTQNKEIGHLGLSFDRSIHIPAYNSDLLSAKNPVTSLGSYSIILTDPLQPAVPVTHAEVSGIVLCLAPTFWGVKYASWLLCCLFPPTVHEELLDTLGKVYTWESNQASVDGETTRQRGWPGDGLWKTDWNCDDGQRWECADGL